VELGFKIKKKEPDLICTYKSYMLKVMTQVSIFKNLLTSLMALWNANDWGW